MQKTGIAVFVVELLSTNNKPMQGKRWLFDSYEELQQFLNFDVQYKRAVMVDKAIPAIYNMMEPVKGNEDAGGRARE